MKKKILTIIALLMFAITLSAQSTKSHWYGFGNSIKRVMEKQQEELAEALFANPNFALPTTNMQFLFRPTITLTAFAIDFSNKPAALTSLTSAGLGISYGKFSTIDAYCYYSVNALLLTEYKFGGTESVKVGAAITVDAYNKLIGAGVGYINGHVMPLITLSHSF
jgi:predicted small secreted protein